MSGEARDKQTLNNFAARAISHLNENVDYRIGKVVANAPDNVIGYERVINAQEVRKNIRKHGDLTRPVSGQPAISTRDFEIIPVVTANGVYRLLGERRGRKPQRLEYRATIDDRSYVYVEIIGSERRRLACLSFYRTK